MAQIASVPTDSVTFLLIWLCNYAKHSTHLLKSTHNMRVPGAAELRRSDVIYRTTVHHPEESSHETPEEHEHHRRPKGFGRPKAVLHASQSPSRSTLAEKKPKGHIAPRQSCSHGEMFYKCANGFTGCCSVDPCDSGGYVIEEFMHSLRLEIAVI